MMFIEDVHVHKRKKGIKKCITKREIKFQDYKICLETNKMILKLQQKFRIQPDRAFKEKVNGIALSANYGKRIQRPDRVATYPLSYTLEKYAEQN